MKFLVLGGTGKVGRPVVKHLRTAGHEVLSLTREDFDLILSPHLPPDMYQVDVVVNCAGLTGIDRCEARPKEAYLLNAVLPAVLASAARRLGIMLVHMSTDMVAAPDPLDRSPGVYATTKAFADKVIENVAWRYVILRLSAVYDDTLTGVLDPLRQWDEGRGRTANNPIKVIPQVCGPVPAWLIGDIVTQIMGEPPDYAFAASTGTYNIASSPVTRECFAEKALRITGRLRNYGDGVPFFNSSGFGRRSSVVMDRSTAATMFGPTVALDWKDALVTSVKRYGLALPSP